MHFAQQQQAHKKWSATVTSGEICKWNKHMKKYSGQQLIRKHLTSTKMSQQMRCNAIIIKTVTKGVPAISSGTYGAISENKNKRIKYLYCNTSKQIHTSDGGRGEKCMNKNLLKRKNK